jgi:hypothetical protein
MKEGRMMNDSTRRHFLKQSLTAAAVASALPLRAAPKPVARAKSIIQIWMWGGPSQLDTFDPKPEAGSDYCGPLTSPIETNVSGIRISEQLPRLAKQADKYSIIRSMTHGVFAHETASYLAQTGREVDGKRVYPGLGSVFSLTKGYDAGYTSSIPPYIVLTTSQGRFSKSGFLGAKYKPFITGGDPNRDPFLVEGFVVEGVDAERQARRRNLLNRFDPAGQATDAFSAQSDAAREQAYRLLSGGELGVFDMAQETDQAREAYGRNWFGQSCLMARRLVEKGVPYICINYPGWDTHKSHFQTVQRRHPEMDQGVAALLEDLSQRGLLDQTIVWWSGEFGRTPRIAWEAPWNGGRGHFASCYSAVVAGGGFAGGQVVGESSRTGEEVARRPVYPQDLLGSFCELMGVNPDAPYEHPVGQGLPVMSPASEYGRLYEIMKGV